MGDTLKGRLQPTGRGKRGLGRSHGCHWLASDTPQCSIAPRNPTGARVAHSHPRCFGALRRVRSATPMGEQARPRTQTRLYFRTIGGFERNPASDLNTKKLSDTATSFAFRPT